MKSWLQNNYRYSTYYKGKSGERFIKTLKKKIYKYMTSASKMCILINKLIYLMNTVMDIIAK